ncbi:MAG: beta-N-acetylhexosaminidase, partial [Burkholderiales bacterium]
VTLFSRNYQSVAQLCKLSAIIHGLRNPALIIAVDHEGGRVQRFRDGFTALPAMGRLGRIWDHDPRRARRMARQVGWVMATELRGCGVDISFAPVLDIDYGASGVIGDRAFHRDPEAISKLARSLQLGMKRGGLPTVGKHFPGHGYIRADSHHDIAIDEREYTQIATVDLVPFQRMIAHGLNAIMAAHVIYPKIDSVPSGFSHTWLHDILRTKLGFDGVVISDDLGMHAASVAGDAVQRATACLQAGCDMALLCGGDMDAVLDHLRWEAPAESRARIMRLKRGLRTSDTRRIREAPHFLAAVQAVAEVAGSA